VARWVSSEEKRAREDQDRLEFRALMWHFAEAVETYKGNLAQPGLPKLYSFEVVPDRFSEGESYYLNPVPVPFSEGGSNDTDYDTIRIHTGRIGNNLMVDIGGRFDRASACHRTSLKKAEVAVLLTNALNIISNWRSSRLRERAIRGEQAQANAAAEAATGIKAGSYLGLPNGIESISAAFEADGRRLRLGIRIHRNNLTADQVRRLKAILDEQREEG